MGRPRQRYTAPVTSARYLVLRHANRIRQALEENPHLEGVHQLTNDHIYADRLAAGYQQLFSKEIPGVQAGDFILTVNQNIDSGTGWKKTETNKQDIHVQGPRFSLPDDAVYSIYPPAGNEVDTNVLPHVVFNDAHMPWNRKGSENWEAKNPPPPDKERNQVPWLALLTFTKDELELKDDAQLRSMFGATIDSKELKLNDKLAAEIAVADIQKINGANASGPTYSNNDLKDATAPSMSVIFPKASLFNAIFSPYDAKGNIMPAPAVDISRHRFLAHIRKVNTEGMAEAGQTEGIPNRDFGIVVSNRSAPSFFEKAQPIYCHLVSIEKLEKITPFPVPLAAKDAPERRVAMVSLHSWIYTCLPPADIDTAGRLQNLCQSLAPLAPALPVPGSGASAVKLRALQRMKDGYTMVRYRVKTGEETVALTRGPLVPTLVDKREKMQSNAGENFRIMDKELGIMDISYSVAWNLGRSMALADRAYTTALVRLRGEIYQKACDETKVRILKQTGLGVVTREDLLMTLKEAIDALHAVAQPGSFSASSGIAATQWKKVEHILLDLSHRSPHMSTIIDEELDRAAFSVSSTSDPPPADWCDPHPPTYNECNMPASVDWMIVLRFVLDLYNLVNVPAHYLITDPAHLPQEALRFFVIDQNWVDALVDGALSLGNQNDPITDNTRICIKKAINRHLETVDPVLKYKTPVPRYGFLIRSVIVTQFPDLKVEVQPEWSRAGPPMLLRHEVISNDTMIGFLSERPIDEGLQNLTFTLPCHQQYFRMGLTFTKDKLVIPYKRINSENGVEVTDNPFPLDTPTWERNKPHPDRPTVYKWSSGVDPNKDDLRLLLIENYAADTQKVLVTEWPKLKKPPNYYREPNPTSAVMGIQLNVAAMMFRIAIPLKNAKFPCELLTYATPDIGLPLSANYTQPQKMPKAPFPTVAMRTRQPEPDHDHHAGNHYRRVLPMEALEDKAPYTPEDSWSNVSSPKLHPHSNRASSISSFEMLPSSWAPGPSAYQALPAPLTRSRNKRLSISSTSSVDSDSPILHPEDTPKFDFSARPFTKPTDRTIKLSTYKQDIIFSIVRNDQNGPPTGGFMIKSLEIAIPCADSSTPSLMKDYTDVRAGMVSNLRFNVLAAYSKETYRMILKIIPRSTKGVVPIEKAREMSVVLYGVRVLAPGQAERKREVKVKWTLEPEYGGKAEDNFIIELEPVKKPPSMDL